MTFLRKILCLFGFHKWEMKSAVDGTPYEKLMKTRVVSLVVPRCKYCNEWK